MRYLFILLLPLFGFCQEPPKKANVIIIKGITFKEVVNGLLDKGYEINKIDSNFLTIKTSPRESTKYPYGWFITLNLRIKDSSAYIRGKIYFEPIGDFDMENTGMKNSIPKTAFARTDAFAKSFGKPVEYLKE